MMRDLGGGTVEHDGLEQWTSSLKKHQIHLKGLLTTVCQDPSPVVGSQGTYSLRICFYNKFPGEAGVPHLEPYFENHWFRICFSVSDGFQDTFRCC